MSGNEMPTIYRMEIQTLAGSWQTLGIRPLSREPVRLPSIISRHTPAGSADPYGRVNDFHLHLVDLQGGGESRCINTASLIAFCSGALGKPVQSQQMAIMGDMSLGGVITPGSQNLAESLTGSVRCRRQSGFCCRCRVWSIFRLCQGELFAKFQTSFYSDPVDAVFKALGVE
jgi:ATP-dependent Lon protease